VFGVWTNGNGVVSEWTTSWIYRLTDFG